MLIKKDDDDGEQEKEKDTELEFRPEKDSPHSRTGASSFKRCMC